jgi:hypothetical protein
MEHKKSIFIFEDKDVEWRVEYYYREEDSGYNDYVYKILCAIIFEDESIYHDFNERLPNTKTENPTKTQAKELISAAKRLNKERDKRDKKIKKILE